MSDEFEGSIPDIRIHELDMGFFTYGCGDTGRGLTRPCSIGSPLSDKCFDCIGFNRRFAKYFRDNRKCPCGYNIDFGYFILIFHLGKANLLPDNFKITCCRCSPYEDDGIEITQEFITSVDDWFIEGESW